jgi:hypothetical protein
MSTTLGGGMREEAGKVGVRGGKRGERWEEEGERSVRYCYEKG